MNFKKLAGLAAAVIMVFSAAACNQSAGDTTDVAVTVDDEKILLQDVNLHVKEMEAMVQSEYAKKYPDYEKIDWETEWEDGQTLREYVVDQAVNKAIIYTLNLKHSNEFGVDIEAVKKDADANIGQIKSQYSQSGQGSFEDALTTYGFMDEAHYKQYLVKMIVDDEMKTNVYNHPELLADIESFKSNDRVSAKHILVLTQDDQQQPLSEEDTAKALELAEKYKKEIDEGADFESYMEFSQDPGQPETGYTFFNGEMVPEFWEAAHALGINQVSGLVKTSYGYHIIKRFAGFAELGEKWKQAAKITINEDALKTLKFE